MILAKITPDAVATAKLPAPSAKIFSDSGFRNVSALALQPTQMPMRMVTMSTKLRAPRFPPDAPSHSRFRARGFRTAAFPRRLDEAPCTKRADPRRLNTGGMILSTLDTFRGGFIRISRSCSRRQQLHDRRLLWPRHQGHQPYAAIAIGAISSWRQHAPQEDRRRAVGPTDDADATRAGEKPSHKAPKTVAKMPNRAAAPSRISLGILDYIAEVGERSDAEEDERGIECLHAPRSTRKSIWLFGLLTEV